MRVQCPSCKIMRFETTDAYDPDRPVRGNMVRSLYPYPIDWLTVSTTGSAEMACPECQAQLVLGGKLSLVPDEVEVERDAKDIDFMIDETLREEEGDAKAVRSDTGSDDGKGNARKRGKTTRGNGV